jgi:hypothetical protein
VVTTLRIVVPEDLIMDGIVGIPRIGDRVDYTLQFYEARPWIHPEMSNEVTARVEQLNGGRCSADRVDPDGRIRVGSYSMLLHSNGWCAYFVSSRLYEGTAQCAGWFEADWPGVLPAEAQVAGTVTRCRLITRVSVPDADGRHTQGWTDTLGPVPDGHTGFRLGLVPATPVPADPRGWHSAMIPPRDGSWTREAGVLVDLDVGLPL